MTKDEAITEHLKHWQKFPVFVWQEGGEYVTQVDGKRYNALNVWSLDNMLDEGKVPAPRNCYFIDEPDYQD
jgi:hypothetical protein